MSLVVLNHYLDLTEAQVVCSFLSAHGLHASLPDENYLGVHWTRLFALGGARVHVPRSMADEARALLANVPPLRDPPTPFPRRWFRKRVCALFVVLVGG